MSPGTELLFNTITRGLLRFPVGPQGDDLRLLGHIANVQNRKKESHTPEARFLKNIPLFAMRINKTELEDVKLSSKLC